MLIHGTALRGLSRVYDLTGEEKYLEDMDEFDCGMCVDHATGELLGCQLAGTEEYDWDYPYREDFEAIARKERK